MMRGTSFLGIKSVKRKTKMKKYQKIEIKGDGVVPEYQTAGAGAVDLHCKDAVHAFPGDVIKVSTGISINIKDRNVAGLIIPRSGLGSRGLVLANSTGLIDSDYQGEIILVLYNRGTKPVFLDKGARAAQMIFIPVVRVIFDEVDEFTTVTERGKGGFGSSGVF